MFGGSKKMPFKYSGRSGSCGNSSKVGKSVGSRFSPESAPALIFAHTSLLRNNCENLNVLTNYLALEPQKIFLFILRSVLDFF
jgi:hypothetical protein